MATIHLKISKGKTMTDKKTDGGDTATNHVYLTTTDETSSPSDADLNNKGRLQMGDSKGAYQRSHSAPGPLERESRCVELKVPWIPAPARTTNNIAISSYPLKPYNSNRDIRVASSAASGASSSRKRKPTKINSRPCCSERNYQSHNRNQTVKLRSRRESKKGKPYSLRTKDSLIDVTACLNEKRMQVMKLWEENLPSRDAQLLNQLEKANDLALDAASDVVKLRNSIQNLQRKFSLSKEDNDKLEHLRNSVMLKLNAFEEANSEVNRILGKHSSQENLAAVELSSKHSQVSLDVKTEDPPRSKSVETQLVPSEIDLVFLKDKPNTFSDTDNDAKGFATESNSNCAVRTCDSSSQVDLSYLNRLYNEKFILPEVKDSFIDCNNENVTDKGETVPQERIHRVVRFQENEQSDKFLKQKLVELQRKLSSQEGQVSELRTELRRIESHSGFQLRLLKTNINDKLEELEVIPELLQLTEQRLGSTMQSRNIMEQSLHEKDRDLNSVRGEMQKTFVELMDSKEKLRRSDLMNNSLALQLQEVMKEKEQLKLELGDCHKSYQAKLEDKQREYSNLNLQLELALKNQTSILVDDSYQVKENAKLEQKISELEDKRSKAERSARAYRKSKEKLSIRMNQRIEELMDNLEDSRRRNRHLINQIQYIKTSYFKLFPMEIFYPNKSEHHYVTSPKSSKETINSTTQATGLSTPRKSSQHYVLLPSQSTIENSMLLGPPPPSTPVSLDNNVATAQKSENKKRVAFQPGISYEDDQESSLSGYV